MTSTRTRAQTATIPSGRPIWRHAPTVLLRFPTLFAALALGAFLVAVAAASYPLFLSASESELLASQIEDPLVTPYGMGVSYRSTLVEFTDPSPDGRGLLSERRGEVFAEWTARSPALGPVVEQILGPVVDVTLPGGRSPASGPVSGRLFAGTDAVHHVTILEGTDGPGVWITDVMARAAHLAPGDRVELGVNDRTDLVRVDGIYRSIFTQSRRGYWRPWVDDIVPICPAFDCEPPPQPILMGHDQLIDIATDLGQPQGAFAWQAPSRTEPPLTLDEAQALVRFGDDLKRQMTSPKGSLQPLFHCCGDVVIPGSCRGSFCSVSNVSFATNAQEVVHQVDERIASIRGPMLVLLVAGLGIALAIVGAASVFVMASRRVEAGVLSARGWGGTAIGCKAVLEAAIPCMVGATVGFAVATEVITFLGPNGRVERSAREASVLATLVAVGASLVLVGVVSAAVFLSSHEHRHRLTRGVAFVPWELLALGGAWVMARRLSSGGAIVESGSIERPGGAVFLFPLLLGLGAGIVAARLMTLALAVSLRRRARATDASAWWLATRRLRSSGRLPQLLLVAGSLTLAVFVSSQALVSSLRTTVEAKAKVFVGSDVQVQVNGDADPATDYTYPFTKVTRSRDAGTFTGTETRFDLLAVDPSTLAAAAYWNGAFSSESLEELVGRLRAEPGGPLPVVIANGGGLDPASIDLATRAVPVHVVGRATSFPGTSSSSRPLVVVDGDSLAKAFAGLADPLNISMATTELWIEGPTDPIVASIDQIDVDPLLVLTASEVQDIPYIDAAIQTFLMLDVLGAVAMILLIVVALVYLQARQRSRVVAGELSERMGQDRATIRRSLILEMGVILLGSLAVGAIVGGLAARVVVSNLDPLPTIPPGPLVVQPLIAVAVGAVAIVIAAVVGGALADRAARRVPLGEVLRVAE